MAEDSNQPADSEQPSDDFASLLARARQGDSDAAGKILHQCRDYLLLIANQDIDRELQRKMGASDLVQESMMTAQAHFDQFRGETREQFLGWLRGILVNDVKHWRRHYKGTQKRNVGRERDVAASAPGAAEPRDRWFTPSSQAAANEEERLLLRAMESLPENYRQIIELRNWRELSFAEIGKELNCTSEAARKLWSRAILKLQEILEKDWPELNPKLLGNRPD